MNSANYSKMLEMASKKLGTSPEALKSSLEKGNIEQFTSSLSDSDKQKLKVLIQNPKLAEQFLNSKQAQDMMKKYDDK